MSADELAALRDRVTKLECEIVRRTSLATYDALAAEVARQGEALAVTNSHAERLEAALARLLNCVNVVDSRSVAELGAARHALHGAQVLRTHIDAPAPDPAPDAEDDSRLSGVRRCPGCFPGSGEPHDEACPWVRATPPADAPLPGPVQLAVTMLSARAASLVFAGDTDAGDSILAAADALGAWARAQQPALGDDVPALYAVLDGMPGPVVDIDQAAAEVMAEGGGCG